jgi:hypothetical protein
MSATFLFMRNKAAFSWMDRRDFFVALSQGACAFKSA